MILRILIGLPIAGLATLGLFAQMQYSIGAEEIELGTSPTPEIVKIVRTPPTDGPEPDSKPDAPSVPPRPLADRNLDPDSDPAPPTSLPELPEADRELTSTGPSVPCTPVVRIQPSYPERCAARAEALEVVTLAFWIAADGSVEDARVISSSNSCFDRSARLALEKWKYNPPTSGGPQCLLQAQLRYQLED